MLTDFLEVIYLGLADLAGELANLFRKGGPQ